MDNNSDFLAKLAEWNEELIAELNAQAAHEAKLNPAELELEKQEYLKQFEKEEIDVKCPTCKRGNIITAYKRVGGFNENCECHCDYCGLLIGTIGAAKAETRLVGKEKPALLKKNDKDNIPTMLGIAKIYYSEQNFEKAVHWYELAGKAGSVEAKEWLDDWYYQDGADTESYS